MRLKVFLKDLDTKLALPTAELSATARRLFANPESVFFFIVK